MSEFSRSFAALAARRHSLLTWALLCSGCSALNETARDQPGAPGVVSKPHVQSLDQLSTHALRARAYGSTLSIEAEVAAKPYPSYLAAYDSDGLRVYARVDVPRSPQPGPGYPVVIFVHGWLGVDAAPALDFYYGNDSNYGEMIDAYVDAGFVVLTPGWRGHGTVNGVPADGIEFMKAWDNGSYLSPVFYAIDVLNLLDGLDTLATAELDLSRINLVAHSQGGDAALIALAVAGEGSNVDNEIHAASIWSGTFPSRFTQLETYEPMQKTQEAFLSGDGTWNGTATGADGAVNPNFVFGYPPDWIGTTEVAAWTWQKDTWSLPTVAAALVLKLEQMYGAINEYVADIDDANYRIEVTPGARAAISHDPRVSAAMSRIGAFDQAQFLTEPLALQHSDRDFYSLPEWNADLCRRINRAGGNCYDFGYVENTHSLRASEHRWFSSEHAQPGFDTALRRDIALFEGLDPNGP